MQNSFQEINKLFFYEIKHFFSRISINYNLRRKIKEPQYFFLIFSSKNTKFYKKKVHIFFPKFKIQLNYLIYSLNTIICKITIKISKTLSSGDKIFN